MNRSSLTLTNRDTHIKVLDDCYNETSSRLFICEKELKETRDEKDIFKRKQDEQIHYTLELEVKAKKFQDLYNKLKKYRDLTQVF